MLALVLLQIFVLGAVLYNSIHRQEAVSADFKRLYDLLEICLKQDDAGLRPRLQSDESTPVELPKQK